MANKQVSKNNSVKRVQTQKPKKRKKSSFAKNVVKSFKTVGINTAMEALNPDFASLIRNNKTIFKDANGKTIKIDRKNVKDWIKNNELVQEGLGFAKDTKNKLFDEIKSGHIFGSEKYAADEATENAFIGLDNDNDYMSGLEDNDFMSGLEDDYSYSDTKSSGKVYNLTNENENHFTDNRSNITRNVNIQNNRLGFDAGLLHSMTDSLIASIGAVSAQVYQVANFHAESTQSFYSASSEFYDSTTELLTKISDNIELMSSVYKAKEEETEITESLLSQVFEGDDIHIKPLLEEMISNTNKLFSSDNEDIQRRFNEIRMMLADPMKAITNEIFSTVIPEAAKEFTSSVMSKFTKYAKSMALSLTNIRSGNRRGGIIGNAISKLIGFDELEGDIIDNPFKNLDNSQYEKGAISFDGLTKKSIVSVIPDYLSKILQQITIISKIQQRIMDDLIPGGSSSIVEETDREIFDYDKGVFTTTKKVIKDLNEQRRKQILETYDVSEFINRNSKNKSKLNEDLKSSLIKNPELDKEIKAAEKRLKEAKEKHEAAIAASPEMLALQEKIKELEAFSTYEGYFANEEMRKKELEAVEKYKASLSPEELKKYIENEEYFKNLSEETEKSFYLDEEEWKKAKEKEAKEKEAERKRMEKARTIQSNSSTKKKDDEIAKEMQELNNKLAKETFDRNTKAYPFQKEIDLATKEYEKLTAKKDEDLNWLVSSTLDEVLSKSEGKTIRDLTKADFDRTLLETRNPHRNLVTDAAVFKLIQNPALQLSLEERIFDKLRDNALNRETGGLSSGTPFYNISSQLLMNTGDLNGIDYFDIENNPNLTEEEKVKLLEERTKANRARQTWDNDTFQKAFGENGHFTKIEARDAKKNKKPEYKNTGSPIQDSAAYIADTFRYTINNTDKVLSKFFFGNDKGTKENFFHSMGNMFFGKNSPIAEIMPKQWTKKWRDKEEERRKQELQVQQEQLNASFRTNELLEEKLSEANLTAEESKKISEKMYEISMSGHSHSTYDHHMVGLFSAWLKFKYGASFTRNQVDLNPQDIKIDDKKEKQEETEEDIEGFLNNVKESLKKAIIGDEESGDWIIDLGNRFRETLFGGNKISRLIDGSEYIKMKDNKRKELEIEYDEKVKKGEIDSTAVSKDMYTLENIRKWEEQDEVFAQKNLVKKIRQTKKFFKDNGQNIFFGKDWSEAYNKQYLQHFKNSKAALDKRLADEGIQLNKEEYTKALNNYLKNFTLDKSKMPEEVGGLMKYYHRLIAKPIKKRVEEFNYGTTAKEFKALENEARERITAQAEESVKKGTLKEEDVDEYIENYMRVWMSTNSNLKGFKANMHRIAYKINKKFFGEEAALQHSLKTNIKNKFNEKVLSPIKGFLHKHSKTLKRMGMGTSIGHLAGLIMGNPMLGTVIGGLVTTDQFTLAFADDKNPNSVISTFKRLVLGKKADKQGKPTDEDEMGLFGFFRSRLKTIGDDLSAYLATNDKDEEQRLLAKFEDDLHVTGVKMRERLLAFTGESIEKLKKGSEAAKKENASLLDVVKKGVVDFLSKPDKKGRSIIDRVQYFAQSSIDFLGFYFRKITDRTTAFLKRSVTKIVAFGKNFITKLGKKLMNGEGFVGKLFKGVTKMLGGTLQGITKPFSWVADKMNKRLVKAYENPDERKYLSEGQIKRAKMSVTRNKAFTAKGKIKDEFFTTDKNGNKVLDQNKLKQEGLTESDLKRVYAQMKLQQGRFNANFTKEEELKYKEMLEHEELYNADGTQVANYNDLKAQIEKGTNVITKDGTVISGAIKDMSDNLGGLVNNIIKILTGKELDTIGDKNYDPSAGVQQSVKAHMDELNKRMMETNDEKEIESIKNELNYYERKEAEYADPELHVSDKEKKFFKKIQHKFDKYEKQQDKLDDKLASKRVKKKNKARRKQELKEVREQYKDSKESKSSIDLGELKEETPSVVKKSASFYANLPVDDESINSHITNISQSDDSITSSESVLKESRKKNRKKKRLKRRAAQNKSSDNYDAITLTEGTDDYEALDEAAKRHFANPAEVAAHEVKNDAQLDAEARQEIEQQKQMTETFTAIKEATQDTAQNTNVLEDLGKKFSLFGTIVKVIKGIGGFLTKTFKVGGLVNKFAHSKLGNLVTKPLRSLLNGKEYTEAVHDYYQIGSYMADMQGFKGDEKYSFISNIIKQGIERDGIKKGGISGLLNKFKDKLTGVKNLIFGRKLDDYDKALAIDVATKIADSKGLKGDERNFFIMKESANYLKHIEFMDTPFTYNGIKSMIKDVAFTVFHKPKYTQEELQTQIDIAKDLAEKSGLYGDEAILFIQTHVTNFMKNNSKFSLKGAFGRLKKNIKFGGKSIEERINEIKEKSALKVAKSQEENQVKMNIFELAQQKIREALKLSSETTRQAAETASSAATNAAVAATEVAGAGAREGYKMTQTTLRERIKGVWDKITTKAGSLIKLVGDGLKGAASMLTAIPFAGPALAAAAGVAGVATIAALALKMKKKAENSPADAPPSEISVSDAKNTVSKANKDADKQAKKEQKKQAKAEKKQQRAEARAERREARRQKWEDTKLAIKEKALALQEKAKETFLKAKEKVQEKALAIKEKALAIKDKAKEKFNNVKSKVTSGIKKGFNFIKDSLGFGSKEDEEETTSEEVKNADASAISIEYNAKILSMLKKILFAVNPALSIGDKAIGVAKKVAEKVVKPLLGQEKDGLLWNGTSWISKAALTVGSKVGNMLFDGVKLIAPAKAEALEKTKEWWQKAMVGGDEKSITDPANQETSGGFLGKLSKIFGGGKSSSSSSSSSSVDTSLSGTLTAAIDRLGETLSDAITKAAETTATSNGLNLNSVVPTTSTTTNNNTTTTSSVDLSIIENQLVKVVYYLESIKGSSEQTAQNTNDIKDNTANNNVTVSAMTSQPVDSQKQVIGSNSTNIFAGTSVSSPNKSSANSNGYNLNLNPATVAIAQGN